MERESNFELLRVFLIIGVIILHINNPVIGGAFTFAKDRCENLIILYGLESLCIGSVNLFVLLTGYFLINNNRREVGKAIKLLFQTIVFAEGTYIYTVIRGVKTFSLKSFVKCLIPCNYFVILYIVVFLISPYINIVIKYLSKKQRNYMVIIMLLLFSMYPTVIDVFQEVIGQNLIGLSSIGAYGSQYGYSIVQFVLMYIVGAWLRYNQRTVTSTKLLVGIGINTILLTGWSFINDYIGYFQEKSAWEYCNSLVILQAVMIFLLFKNYQIKSKLINIASGGVFSVYLLHNLFLNKEIIQKIISLNPLLMVLCILLYAMIIYCICWCIFFIYNAVTKKIWDRIKFPVFELMMDSTKGNNE